MHTITQLSLIKILNCAHILFCSQSYDYRELVDGMIVFSDLKT